MMRGWGGVRRFFMQVKDFFNETFRNELTPISKSTVERIVKCFEDTGSVKDRSRIRRPITAHNRREIIGRFTINRGRPSLYSSQSCLRAWRKYEIGS